MPVAARLRILFPVALTGLLLGLPGAPEGPPPMPFGSPVPLGTSLRTALDTPGTVDGQPALWVRARTAGERLRTWTVDTERRAAREDLEACVAALARSPGRRDLPWREWIEAARYPLPELAETLFRGASEALGPDAQPLALAFDDPTSPDGLRLGLLRFLWAVRPLEGAKHTRRLFLDEIPRAGDTLRPRVITEILAVQEGPLRAAEADRLLLEAALRERLPERTRREAVKALDRRGVRQAAPSLEGIFLGEGASQILRSTALVALLHLDPPRGREVLLERVPDAVTEGILYETFRRLRKDQGLVPLPLPPPGSRLEIELPK